MDKKKHRTVKRIVKSIVRRKQIASKALGIALACLMIGTMFGALPSIARAADNFNIGDTVEVQNTGSIGLKVRDSPAGNQIGGKFDGDRGVIVGGPQSAALGGVTYTWWRIQWEDGLVGWSAEGYPEGVYYLKKVTTISARIDSYSPSASVNVTVPGSVTLSVTFTNTGNSAWSFIAGATVWDANGNQVANYSTTLASALQPGQQTTISWSHPVNQAGDYWLQFGVWKDGQTLLDRKPSPSQKLIVGTTTPTPHIRTPISSIDFGTVTVGSNLNKTTTIFNDGNATLTINSITRTSGSSEFASISPSAPFSVVTGGSQTVTIRFSPTSVGSKSATFTVSSNDSGESSVTFSVSGSGVTQTGTINVTSDPLGASFSLSGPATYSGTTPWSKSNAPVGTCTITWGSMSGYDAPPTESKTLVEGDTISFYGPYEIRAEVLVRIDSYSANPDELIVGEDSTLRLSFTNIGDIAWTFYAAVSLRKPNGDVVHLPLKPVTLDLSQQGRAEWSYTIDMEGSWDVAFDVWKESSKETSLGHTEWLTGYVTGRAVAKPVITSPLTIFSSSPYYPYQEGDVLVAAFSITNRGQVPITFDELVVGGRVSGEVVDFPKVYNVTLNPSDTYDYVGSLTLEKAGLYYFFCAYYIENPTPQEKELLDKNNWNTAIDVEVDGKTIDDPYEANRYRKKVITVLEKATYIYAPTPKLWKEIHGPWEEDLNGRDYQIRAIAAGPNDAESIYVAVGYHKHFLGSSLYPFSFSEDIFRLSEGRWEKISDGLPFLNINAIAIAPSDPSVIYVGGSNHGVHKSVNGTWESLDGPEGGRWIFAFPATILSIAVDPVDPNTVYVGTEDYGFWKKSAGGNWKNIREGFSAVDVSVADVLRASPHKLGTIYASGYWKKFTGDLQSWGILKSGDGGSSWGDKWTKGVTIDIAVAGRDKEIVYVATTSYGGKIPLTSPFGNHTVITVPVLADGVFRYDGEGNWDDRNSWHDASGRDGRNPLPEYSPVSLAINPDFPNMVFTAFWKGVYYSPNFGNDWFPLGLKDQFIYKIVFAYGGDSSVLYTYGAKTLFKLNLSNTAIIVRQHSPSELRVYDSQGRVTGVVNGKVKEEVPSTLYNDNTVVIFFPSDSYRYEVTGTDEGTYGLTVASVEDGETSTLTLTNVLTSASTIHQYTVDWDVLSGGEEGITMRIDSDGDGTFENTFNLLAMEEETEGEITTSRVQIFMPGLVIVETPQDLPEFVRIAERFEVRLMNVVPETPIELMIENSKISRVWLDLGEARENVKTTIEKLEEKPPEFPDPPGLVWAYHRIEVNVPEDAIENAEIDFWVPKEWLATHGVSKEDIRLFRFGEGWEELETEILGENTAHVSYRAGTPGFSVFAITAYAPPAEVLPLEINMMLVGALVTVAIALMIAFVVGHRMRGGKRPKRANKVAGLHQKRHLSSNPKPTEEVSEFL